MKNPKSMLAAGFAVAVLFGAWGVGVLDAQQPGFARALLQDRDLGVPERHAVQVLAQFAPGAIAGKHTHPGEELGYILEGTLELTIEGQPLVTLKAGDTFFVPAGVIHDGKNVGDGVAKVLATYIVEKGKPVATPVK